LSEHQVMMGPNESSEPIRQIWRAETRRSIGVGFGEGGVCGWASGGWRRNRLLARISYQPSAATADRPVPASLPEELQHRQRRLEKIREAKRRLEERQKEEDRQAGRSEDDDNNASGVRPQGGRSKYQRSFGEVPETKQENFTDPESRIMKTGDGFQQCYNGQAAVDGETQLIVSAAVEQNAADNRFLVPLTKAAAEHAGRDPERVLADAGYASEANFDALQKWEIPAYVSLGQEGKSGRKISAEQPATRAMKQRLASAGGRDWYRKRKAMVEPVFGWIKEALGFRRFSVRGLAKARGEWQLICTVVNLRRLRVLSSAAEA